MNNVYKDSSNSTVFVPYGANPFNLSDGVGKVLNKDLYNLNNLSNVIRIGTVYVGDAYLNKTITPYNYDYKSTSLRNTNPVLNVGVSLPRAGEFFAAGVYPRSINEVYPIK